MRQSHFAEETRIRVQGTGHWSTYQAFSDGVKKQGYALRMDQRGTKSHQNCNPGATQLRSNLHTQEFSPPLYMPRKKSGSALESIEAAKIS